MAYFQVSFRSLREGTPYTVDIFDGSTPSGTAVQLTGGASPFYTEEDNDEDWFLPVRTQSGYLRIVDTGKDRSGNTFDWQSLIPATAKSLKVRLRDDNNNIKWLGYIQPRTFCGQMYAPTQEREYPIMCPLMAISGIDVETTANGAVTFAYLLTYLLTQSGVTFSYIHIQGNGADVVSWLQKKVNWENFVDEDEDNHRTSRYDCLTLLEEICKFWGWVARTSGDELFLLSPDEQTSFVRLDMQDLSTINSGNTPQYTEENWVPGDIDDDIYASTNNQVEILRGVKKVTIDADINVQDTLFEFAPEQTHEYMMGTPFTRVTAGTDQYRYISADMISFSTNRLTGSCIGGGGSFNVEERYEGNIIKHTPQNWEDEIRIQKSYLSPANPRASLIYNLPEAYDDGKFTLSADIYRGFSALDATNTMYISIGVGMNTSSALWFNGTTWTSTKAAVQVSIGNGIGICSWVAFGTNRAYFPSREIPVETPLYGKVFIDFLGSDDVDLNNDNERSFEIVGFSLSFRRNGYRTSRNNYRYSQSTGVPFENSASVQTIFASGNSETFGRGVMLNYDGSYCEDVDYGNTTERPEEHLLARMVARGSVIKHKETIEVRDNLIAMTPLTNCETDGAWSGYPMSISHDWHDDLTRAMLLEY